MAYLNVFAFFLNSQHGYVKYGSSIKYQKCAIIQWSYSVRNRWLTLLLAEEIMNIK